MPLTLKFVLFIVSVNALVFCQTPGQPSQPAKLSLPTYVLEPVETSAATYPAAAREQKIQGEITAFLLVSETGAVENVGVFKGDKLLASAAQEALRKWRFKPVMVDGVATAVGTKATISFVLDNNNPNPTDVMPVIAPATQFPKRVRVSSGVATGLLVSKVTPVYPDVAKAEHIQGAVVLQAIVDKEGTIRDLQLVSGPRELAASAIEAVKQWRYRPYLLNGRPVEVETQIQVNFSLAGR
jgi:TonB family protein